MINEDFYILLIGTMKNEVAHEFKDELAAALHSPVDKNIADYKNNKKQEGVKNYESTIGSIDNS